MAQGDILDGLFAEAAAKPALPSAELVKRILADAEATQPRPAVRHRSTPASPGWISAFADWFGGGTSLVGMTAAAAMGLFLGVAQPASVLTLTELVTGVAAADPIELLPATGTLWMQE